MIRRRHAVALFPENEIEIFREYVPDGLHDLMAAMREGLDAAFIQVNGAVTGPNADLVAQIRGRRAELRGFLGHPSFDAARGALRDIASRVPGRDFDNARTAVEQLAGLDAVPRVFGFDPALRTSSVSFREAFSNPDGGPVFSVPRTLPGYGGPIPNAAQRSEILAWSSFLSKDPEHRFRLGLLRAEVRAGLRDHDAALREYDGLLVAPSGLSAAQRKFVALRAGMTHLAAGDVAFRSARRLGNDTKARARSHYEAAVAVVEQQGVSPENPAHAQIVDYARNHISMLAAGINFLGLRDSFVPVQRHQFLLARTNDHVEAARDAVGKFVTYQEKADELQAAEQEIGFELEVARTGIETALDRQSIAAGQVTRTGIQIEQIENQQGPFSMQSLAGVFEWAGKMASSPDPSGVSMALGTAGMITGHIARQQELEFQHRLAEVDRDNAKLEEEIAASEVEIARKRVTFLEAKIAFGSGRLDKDLYYALALVYEQLAERQVEAAIRFAYLYERAIAFFLGKPGISHVRLDYRSGDGSLSFGLDPDGRLITAADQLNADVVRVSDELADLPPENVRRAFTEPPFSLAREFPLEFSRFVQTAPGQEAQMDFGISFLQLCKRRPDCHQVRILKVTVKIPAVSASANFAGTLTHWGRFLVRDRADTLDPATTRLVPTDEAVEAALRDQQETGIAQAAIGGVLPYALDPQAVPFGVPSDVTSEFREFTLGDFEGYGPAGRWQLELRNINVRNLFDITLTFDLEAATDTNDLEARVVPLIAAYEQELADGFLDGETLDRITVLSMRRQFRSAFEDLESGVGTFTLSAELFDDEDFDGEDARVRTVIAQALDAAGAGVTGVALEISKPVTSFLVTRTTGADGLSEDFGQGRPPIQPPGSRPPGAGAWQVRLPDPSQFGVLNDLVLFFLCDLRPTG
jgi:hypothetical protein